MANKKLFIDRTWAKMLPPAGFALAFISISAMLFWKCRYGFGNIDEAFYLTIPWRFVQGDRMILHEWHMTQFAGFTMIPLVWLYGLFTSSADGIILAFRYIFTFSWCAACLFYAVRLRRIHKTGAAFVSLILLAYAPYGVMALSYNSLVLLYLMNSIVLLLTARKHQKLQFFFSGLFFAGAVLCCPYLIIIYLIASIILLFIKLIKKDPVIPFNQAHLCTCWLFFTLGAAALAGVFLFTLLSGVSVQQVIRSLELALQDPEHAAFSFSGKMREYYIETVRFNGYIRPLIAGLVVVILLTYARKWSLWLAAACGMVAVYLWKFVEPHMIMNYLMYPLSYAGIYLLFVRKNTRIRWISLLWFLPGVVGTVCLHFSSNQGFYAISHGAVISSLASVMMLWQYCDELKEEYHAKGKDRKFYLLAPLAVFVLLAYQLMVQIPIRYDSVFWEQGLMEDKANQTFITEGPEKGLIASKAEADEYDRVYQDIKEIHHQNVLFLSHNTWMPLANDNRNASFSAWLSVYAQGMNTSTLERLEAYYELCPDKKPDLIFLDRRYADQIAYFEKRPYEIHLTEHGNYLIYPVPSA